MAAIGLPALVILFGCLFIVVVNQHRVFHLGSVYFTENLILSKKKFRKSFSKKITIFFGVWLILKNETENNFRRLLRN